MRSNLWVLASALLSMMLVPTAQAERIFTYEFGSTQYNVPPGESVDVQVFLVETLSGGDLGDSWLASETLSSAAVRLSYLDPIPADKATLTSADRIAPNPQFDDPGSPAKPLKDEIIDDFVFWAGSPPEHEPIAGLSEWVNLFATTGVSPEVVVPGSKYRIPLGTFRFTAGTQHAVFTTVQATDLYPWLDETVTFANLAHPLGITLDGLILSGETVIATIPEPSAVALSLGAVFAGACFWAVRRRRAT